MILVTLVFVFVANILIKGESVDIIELVVFSIALVVSVVPEALPVVTTVSLSKGALQLAQHDVVVKRLTAIEDIGSIEVLCSDKTGTLTENALTVTEISPGADPRLLSSAALTVAETKEKTEPFDIAIVEGAARIPGESIGMTERLGELPFDPATRKNSVLVRTATEIVLIVRGAPEEILRLSPSFQGPEREAVTTWPRPRGRSGWVTTAATSSPAARMASRDGRANWGVPMKIRRQGPDFT
jgi:Mg2+-importing ATPase